MQSIIQANPIKQKGKFMHWFQKKKIFTGLALWKACPPQQEFVLWNLIVTSGKMIPM